MQSLLDKLNSGDSAVSAMLWIGLGLILLIVVIAIALWLIRALRPALNLSSNTTRGGRVQRLAVTDAFPLDREGRKLVIIRRDNVEHLLLIGGTNDVVIEQGIVRGERGLRGRAEGEPLMEPTEPAKPVVALQSNLVPPPAAPPQAPQRPMAPPAPVAPPVTRPMAQPVMPAAGATSPAAVAAVARFEVDFERDVKTMEHPAMPAQAPAPARPVAPAPSLQQAPQVPQPFAVPPAQPVVQAPPLPSPPRAEAPRAETSRPEPMSEMARRLSEVLQRPIVPPGPRASVAPPIPPASIPPATMPVATMPVATMEPEAAPAPPPPPARLPTESEMDMLEEEMAKLLGRPAAPPRP
jgi:flagellar protein FliO/FliZ